MVERAPQIVDGVPNEQGDVSGNWGNSADLVSAVSGIRIVLGQSWIAATIDKARPGVLKLEDVVIGPF